MLTLAALVCAVLQASGGSNALPNAAFEEPDHRPAGWDTHVWSGSADFAYVNEGRMGSRCVRIASAPGGDVAWFRTVPVQPYSVYRLSGWIKTDRVVGTSGEGALLNLHNGASIKTPALTGTRDWTEVSVQFETDAMETVTINCLFGGWGQATGTAWYDDLRLERIGEQTMTPSVVIDTARTGPAISEYIYGQFIEHLGRCIYGGIWAEMLEDRKFFYGVGEKDSPWQPVPAGSVRMETEGAYVGERTPRVDAGGGITQGGLGVVQGKEYTGRIVLAGSGNVDVVLRWGDGPGDAQTVSVGGLTDAFQKFPLKFTAGASTDGARLTITGTAAFRVGTVSLMPADNVRGMRADTLALLKELDSPIYRWPGGNFVSGYNWRDGLGERDRRPPRKNPAWQGVEHNDFGIHEFLDFCQEIGTDPYITVNSGLGTVDSARDEVEYVNGAADTPMGRLRAENGHPEPWHVTWWSVGNEMYGDWQLGHMPLSEYVKKHNQFAEAMRAADPAIKLVAVGATGEWSETMLAQCAGQMDLLSEHFYCGQKPGLIEHVRQVAGCVRDKAEAQRKYWNEIPALKDKHIRVALDEYNYWYGPDLYGEVGTRYFLQDALGIAGGLQELTRNTDVFEMANYAQAVNVIGCIKTSKTAASFETTGLVLKMYRHHYGVIPVAVTGQAEPLDVSAAWNADKTALTLGVVNPTVNPVNLAVTLNGATASGPAHLWRITGPDRMAYNEPGKEPPVTIQEADLPDTSAGLSAAPLSVTIFVWPASTS